MLVSEGKTALKRYGFDDSDPLLVWLNAGMREFESAYEWNFLQVKAQLPSVAGVDTLALPANAFKVISIKSSDTGVKLKFLPSVEFEGSVEDPTTPGTPRIYTVVGTSTIILYPAPDVVESYRVFYQEELSDMTTDTANMPGPSRIHYPIVMGAAYIALQSENEEERSVTALTQFERSVDKLWAKYNKQELDEPQQVEDVMGYV